MQVEIHIDDLGLYPADLSPLSELHRSGYLQGVSLVANGGALESGCEFVRANPSLRCAVHLNLLEGPALSPRQSVQLLVDRNGVFRHTFLSLWSFHQSEVEQRTELRAQILREVTAQIRFVQERCGRGRVSVDSHRYAHLLPFVWPALLEPGLLPAIEAVRTVCEPWTMRHPLRAAASLLRSGNALKLLLLNRLSRPLERALAERSVDHCDFSAGLGASGRMNSGSVKSVLRTIARRSPNEPRVQVVFHPLLCASTCAGAHHRFYGSHSRTNELLTLQSPEFRAMIDSFRSAEVLHETVE